MIRAVVYLFVVCLKTLSQELELCNAEWKDVR
jgi:hypothetical protein